MLSFNSKSELASFCTCGLKLALQTVAYPRRGGAADGSTAFPLKSEEKFPDLNETNKKNEKSGYSTDCKS